MQLPSDILLAIFDNLYQWTLDVMREEDYYNEPEGRSMPNKYPIPHAAYLSFPYWTAATCTHWLTVMHAQPKYWERIFLPLVNIPGSKIRQYLAFCAVHASMEADTHELYIVNPAGAAPETPEEEDSCIQELMQVLAPYIHQNLFEVLYIETRFRTSIIVASQYLNDAFIAKLHTLVLKSEIANTVDTLRVNELVTHDLERLALDAKSFIDLTLKGVIPLCCHTNEGKHLCITRYRAPSGIPRIPLDAFMDCLGIMTQKIEEKCRRLDPSCTISIQDVAHDGRAQLASSQPQAGPSSALAIWTDPSFRTQYAQRIRNAECLVFEDVDSDFLNSFFAGRYLHPDDIPDYNDQSIEPLYLRWCTFTTSVKMFEPVLHLEGIREERQLRLALMQWEGCELIVRDCPAFNDNILGAMMPSIGRNRQYMRPELCWNLRSLTIKGCMFSVEVLVHFLFMKKASESQINFLVAKRAPSLTSAAEAWLQDKGNIARYSWNEQITYESLGQDDEEEGDAMDDGDMDVDLHEDSDDEMDEATRICERYMGLRIAD
ncbi:hypothetical protein CONPUDRAFT_158414 [Coniophora puteana RWD-64-598 SS2]|uniref:F-box domain-containing protein n=1 Tax=Coniophora puteana (strain RWD-64-598) TaxID=741705 RepID=A0A5M3MBF3_CONPW|nr:uncharacterized protein CONPUDRAFT_158414 [Coniophora puteana RWD-64-598 SS2]EIW76387.1 hypothetical protein CONPUDRAFT_158414 [Coniophora puteana RWD-64-598 SS2]